MSANGTSRSLRPSGIAIAQAESEPDGLSLIFVKSAHRPKRLRHASRRGHQTLRISPEQRSDQCNGRENGGRDQDEEKPTIKTVHQIG